MVGSHETVKHLGDLGASISTIFVMVSHFAALATPIITLLIALLTLGWWVLRYVEKFSDKRKSKLALVAETVIVDSLE